MRLIFTHRFVQNCGGESILRIPEADSDRVKLLIDETVENFERDSTRGLQQINYQGLAKVCETDATTVELIVNEIFATIVIYSLLYRNLYRAL